MDSTGVQGESRGMFHFLSDFRQPRTSGISGLKLLTFLPMYVCIYLYYISLQIHNREREKAVRVGWYSGAPYRFRYHWLLFFALYTFSTCFCAIFTHCSRFSPFFSFRYLLPYHSLSLCIFSFELPFFTATSFPSQTCFIQKTFLHFTLFCIQYFFRFLSLSLSL